MAFANYDNGNLQGRQKVVGVVKAYGNYYEFAERTVEERAAFAPDYAHKIFVGPAGAETRAVKLLKTVAYVAVDEDEFGNPVSEKWIINRREYA